MFNVSRDWRSTCTEEESCFTLIHDTSKQVILERGCGYNELLDTLREIGEKITICRENFCNNVSKALPSKANASIRPWHEAAYSRAALAQCLPDLCLICIVISLWKINF
ncbi:hypothetical protein L9F63_019265 [Diploptera punctata]|uniref:Uncharacterized protein n=1 Tax=Diploptera punctata TaxID=6984 RepID=A0AAD8EEK7_DIPPU|nr:hypothetical protein L9F63_019265 [Diploptera punctata]